MDGGSDGDINLGDLGVVCTLTYSAVLRNSKELILDTIWLDRLEM